MTELRSITGRSKPYRQTSRENTPCIRCGIHQGRGTVCKDCKPEAIRLGWIDGPQTYECSDCGKTVTKTYRSRETCRTCTWKHARRKAA